MENLQTILSYAKDINYPLQQPRNIYLEYLQYEMLQSIFRHTDKLSFIGGTALRIIYGSQRFSEDLDFDNFGLNENDFEHLTEKVSKDMNTLGFDVEFRNVYKGAYHCYFRFSDVLYNFGLSPNKDEKILVRIDTVNQNVVSTPSVAVLDRFGLFFEIRHNSKDILLSQKFLAILGRKRSKGRDFYDVTFLMGMTSPNLEYLTSKAQINSLSELKEKILERCREINFDDMARDVEPFLFNARDTLRIQKFRQYIEQWDV